jgi:hypothetical protein
MPALYEYEATIEVRVRVTGNTGSQVVSAIEARLTRILPGPGEMGTFPQFKSLDVTHIDVRRK